MNRDIASRLEALEAAAADTSEMLVVLRQVGSPERLWDVAAAVVPYVPIMRMIYRRALEIGASEERARAYLASAHAFSGDNETASAIVAGAGDTATDDLMLETWAVLAEDPISVTERLRLGLQRRPESLRLRRRLLSEAMRNNDDACAKEVLASLLRDETDRAERERLRSIQSEKQS